MWQRYGDALTNPCACPDTWSIQPATIRHEGTVYPCGRTTLGPGDTLVVYTDGLTEAMSPEREMFGLERIVAGLTEGRGDTLPALRTRLLARVEAHTASASLDDDLTLLLLRRSNEPARGAAAEPWPRAPQAQEADTRV